MSADNFLVSFTTNLTVVTLKEYPFRMVVQVNRGLNEINNDQKLKKNSFHDPKKKHQSSICANPTSTRKHLTQTFHLVSYISLKLKEDYC